MLEIIRDEFAKGGRYHVVLLTHNRVWFDVCRLQLDEKAWKSESLMTEQEIQPSVRVRLIGNPERTGIIAPGPCKRVASDGTPMSYAGAPPVIQWNLYSGPGVVTFGNAAQTNTIASFSAPGTYTLLLSADDSVHAVAYDAIVITVSNAISVSLALTGANE